jgi:Flp pilus assembly protein TadD
MNRPSTSILCMAVAGLLLLSSTSARADEYADVDKLFGERQFAEAVQKADRYLATNPKDARMRFLKGLVLSEQGKSAEAIEVFVKLSADHPELPEPYNNLAVLYGKQGQYDQARRSLESAIRTNPSYATAYENLGDVYAKLASQAYSKALQIDGNNPKVSPKLAMIRELFGPQGQAKIASGPASAVRPPVVATAPAPVPAPAATPPASATTPPAKPAAPVVATADTKGPQAAALAWAAAWSRKDMPAYFAAYTRDFSAGKSRKAWEEERRARIVGKRSIDVDLSEFEIEVKGDRATVHFRQAYKADSLRISGNKRLEMVRVSGRWLIQKESTGS